MSGGYAVSGEGISAAFTGQVQGPSAGPLARASLTNTNTIYGAAGQCVRWDYAGVFPTTANLDLGNLTLTVGATVTTATKESDLSYFQSGGTPLWTAAGQTVTLAASGAGANAAFSVSGQSPGAAFTVTAPTIVQYPGVNSIPTGSDYVFTWTGAPDGSSLVVTLDFPASSAGTFFFAQSTPLTVSGTGFSWANQLSVTPLDPQGNLLNNGYT